eukprot:jgi/Tetstr1/434047/TSEL_023191.t1
MTLLLRRDLEWWVAVPNNSNGRSIYKPVEKAYMHVDSSGYGWGAVLNETTEARGFWYAGDRELHITYKELKAVRYAVLTFLSELRGRQVLLREDNMGVVRVLANLTSRCSPMLMTELRQLWFILASNDISIRARHIKTTVKIWAGRPSRKIHYDDRAVSLRHFNHLGNIWGRHTIDRFATMENVRLPRYNSRWRDPCSEATDSMRLSDGAWRREHD